MNPNSNIFRTNDGGTFFTTEQLAAADDRREERAAIRHPEEEDIIAITLSASALRGEVFGKGDIQLSAIEYANKSIRGKHIRQ